ncbi:DUF2206 domain-containing protein [Streptomyces zhihengii]
MTTVTALTARTTDRRGLIGATLLAGAVELVPGAPTSLLLFAGLWLVLGAPAVLWYGVASRAVSTRDGRVMLSVGLAVVTAVVVPLVVNTVLPLLGDDRPLTRTPLTIASVLAVLLLAQVIRPPERPAGEPAWWTSLRERALPPGLLPVAALGGVTLVLAVAGAIRLNNGLGAAVAVAAITGVTALLVLLLVRCRRWSAGVVETGLFLAAGALLLMTSLRGWFITGHDIQREYEVFRITDAADRWNVSAFQDPYNACLSVTLLPTSMAELTGLTGLYVFKAVLPLLFAMAPALVHRSVRNVAPPLVAVLSAVYFMAFPTFFTDMTFLARQEIAYLLIGCALVVVTDRGRPLGARRVMVTVLILGIVLAHYSTTYVLVLTLGIALLTDVVWRLATRLRHGPAPGARAARGFVTWWMVASLAAAAFVWAGPATHTSGQLQSTVSTAVRDLVSGQAAEAGSSDTSYSLFGGTKVSPEQRIADYRAHTEEMRAAGDPAYNPLSLVDAYPTPAAEKEITPLTPLGRQLDDLGVDVPEANSTARTAAAALIQVLLLAGVASTVLSRHRAFRPTRDQLTLTAGTVAVLGVLTVLPQLSVDYGVLRAFQQGLFVFAPFVAAGSLWVLRWAGRRSALIAGSLAVLLFLNLTGVVPKLIGGAPPQLNLADAGEYYDIYYVHPEERAAIEWLYPRTEHSPDNVQSEVHTDRYAFREKTPTVDRALDDFYPPLVRKDAYVFLGSTTVRKGEATTFYGGDLITYRYPVPFLDGTKNKVYSSEGSEIFK